MDSGEQVCVTFNPLCVCAVCKNSYLSNAYNDHHIALETSLDLAMKVHVLSSPFHSLCAHSNEL